MYGQGANWDTCQPAGFLSKKFTRTQHNYHTHEHKTLVVLEALMKWEDVRYQSLMDLQQVHSTLSSSATTLPSQSLFYFHHISDTPPFVPAPLVSSFIPMFPVSLISISMSLWSSHLLHIVFSPVPVFPCFTLVPFVPSPWPSQANPAA